mmetsp:Transcript_12191/g.18418  ORF Transcript_12191/g.18418 Transcript_12191/m.18418 type:complete len:99 (+) Transcript_12191:381-677(+)
MTAQGNETLEHPEGDCVLSPHESVHTHPKASITAALYEGSTANGLLQAPEERFLNLEYNTAQAEVTEYKSMNLSCKVSKDDKLTIGSREASLIRDILS